MNKILLGASVASLSILLMACGGSSSSNNSGTDSGGTDTGGTDTGGTGTGGTETGTNSTIGTASYDPSTKEFVVNQDGTEYKATSNVTFNGQPALFSATDINGNTYWTASSFGADDYVAFGGVSNDNVFLGQSGTLQAPINNIGKVTYSGRYSYAAVGTNTNSPFSLSADFDNDSITTSEGDLMIDGKIDGNNVTGTAEIGGYKGDLEAGFYAGNELNGVATDNKNFVASFFSTAQ